MKAFWLPPHEPELAGRAPTSSAFQRGGGGAGGGGAGGARGGGGGRAGGGAADAFATVHRAKSAWGTQGTTGR